LHIMRPFGSAVIVKGVDLPLRILPVPDAAGKPASTGASPGRRVP
jgi:hypothetical protein